MRSTRQRSAIARLEVALVAALAALMLLAQPLTSTMPAAAAGTPPRVDDVIERVGPAAGGATVVIQGAGFTGATGVRFGPRLPAASFTVDSDTQITAVTPPRPASSEPWTLVDVLVDTPAGTSPTDRASYRYLTAPQILSVSPTTSSVEGGQTIELTVSGLTFDWIRRLEVDGAEVTDFWSDSELDPRVVSVLTPPHPAGPATIRLENAGGVSNTVSIGYIQVPRPEITGFAPMAGPSDGGTTVVLTGANLSGTTAVIFDGQFRATSLTVDSDHQITFVTPQVPSFGPYPMAVWTAAGHSTDVATFDFTGPPELVSSTPTEGPIHGGTVVRLTGRGFDHVTGVRIGSTPAASWTVIDDTAIDVVTPPLPEGTHVIFVDSASGPNVDLGAAYFTAMADGPPVVTGVSPNHGPLAGGNTVVITGTGFSSATTVAFGEYLDSPLASFTVDGDTQITAVAPPGAWAATFQVVVTNDLGVSSPTTHSSYRFDPAPRVWDVEPYGGPVTGGQTVVVQTQDPAAVTAVRFGDVPATSFGVNPSGPGLVVVTPPHVAGAVAVIVTTDGGTSWPEPDAANRYTFVAPGVPIVRSLDPQTAYALGGGQVTITATDAAMTTGVRFGDVASPAFTILDATHVRADIPPHPTGITTVILESLAGEGPDGTDNAFWFQTTPPPEITAMSPARGPMAGGNEVTITGTGFAGVTDVRFGTVPATSFTVESGSRLVAIAPAYLAPYDLVVTVSVTTPLGTSGSNWATGYVYQTSDSLRVDLIEPARSALAGGQLVRFWGRGFTGTSAVRFGDVPSPRWIVVNDGTMDVEVPAMSEPYLYDVTVTTPTGTSVPSPSTWFLYVDEPEVWGMDRYAGPTAGGEQVTITGDQFYDVYDIVVGGTYLSYAVVDSHTIVAFMPACAEGTFVVEVRTRYGRSALSLGSLYTYHAPGKPVVTKVAANRGATSGGETVIITGTGFLDASAVRFENTSAASFTVDSDTQITAVVPARASAALVNVFVDVGSSSNPSGPASWYLYEEGS